MNSDFEARLRDSAAEIEQALHDCLPAEDAFAAPIDEAVRYSLFAGGKRIRPLMVCLSAQAAGGSATGVFDAACGVELIHTSSLILDDLPCMDDADMRRGKQATHVKFGEANTILASYFLQVWAFTLITRNAARAGLGPERIEVVTALAAEKVGIPGMVGGQAADLQIDADSIDLQGLLDINARKTGAMFELSASLGAMLCGAGDDTVAALSAYGGELGAAFQIMDDLNDEEGADAGTGNSEGQDAHRPTTVDFMGRDGARARVEQLCASAVAHLEPLGDSSAPLTNLVAYIRRRTLGE